MSAADGSPAVDTIRRALPTYHWGGGHDSGPFATWEHGMPDAAETLAAHEAVDALVAELDDYRDALERIYRTGRGVLEIARDALNAAGESKP